MEHRGHLPGAAATLSRTLSALANPYPTARDAENRSPPVANVWRAVAGRTDPWPITHPRPLRQPRGHAGAPDRRLRTPPGAIYSRGLLCFAQRLSENKTEGRWSR